MYWALALVALAAVRDRAGDEAGQRPKRPSHAVEHRGVAPLDENVDFTPAPPDTAI